MQIKTVTTRVHSRRYESQFRNSRHPWKEKHALLVFITISKISSTKISFNFFRPTPSSAAASPNLKKTTPSPASTRSPSPSIAPALAANAHFAASIPNPDSLELRLLHQSLFEKLWEAGYKIANGRLDLSVAPGLGINLLPDDPAFTDPIRQLVNSSTRQFVNSSIR